MLPLTDAVMVAETLPAPSAVDSPAPAKGTVLPWSFTNPLKVKPELPVRVAAVHCSAAFAAGTRLARSNANEITANIGIAKLRLIVVLLSAFELEQRGAVRARTSRTVAQQRPKIKDRAGGLLVPLQVADFCGISMGRFLGKRLQEA